LYSREIEWFKKRVRAGEFSRASDYVDVIKD